MPTATETVTETEAKTNEVLAAVGADAASASKAEANPQQAVDDAESKRADTAMLEAYRKLAGEEVKAAEPVAGEPKPEAVEKVDESPKAEDQPKSDGNAEPERVEKAREILESIRSFDRKLSRMSDKDVLAAAEERAANALKRWKYPEDVISGLTWDRRMELASQAITEQAKQDDEGNRRAEVQAALDKIEAERAAAAATATTKAEKQAINAAADNEVDAILSALEDENVLVWSDAVEPLKKAFGLAESRATTKAEQRIVAIEKAYEDRIKSMQQEAEAAEKHLLAQLDRVELRYVRDKLVGEIPQLADPAKWKAVRTRTYSLANLNGYTDDDGAPDVEKLVRDAAGLEFKSTTKQDFQDQLAGKFKKQINGQPSDMNRGAPPAALDEDARMKMALNLMAQGKTPDEARGIIASTT